MNATTPNYTFLSRNQQEIAEVISLFKELTSCYDNQLVLYLDQFDWEIFDTRCAIPVIRHRFKHLKNLREDLIKLRNDYINVGCAAFRDYGRFSFSEVISIKRIYMLYGYDTYFFKTKALQDYVTGKFEKAYDY